MPDQDVAEAAKVVEKDLAKSNALLEKGATGGQSWDYNAETILLIKFDTTPLGIQTSSREMVLDDIG